MKREDEYNRGYYWGETHTPDAMRGYEARQRENRFYRDYERAEVDGWKWAYAPDTHHTNQTHSPKNLSPEIDLSPATKKAILVIGIAVLVCVSLYVFINWALQLKSDYPILGHTYDFVGTWYNIFLAKPVSYFFQFVVYMYQYVVNGSAFDSNTDTIPRILRFVQLAMGGLFVGILAVDIAKRLKPLVADKVRIIENLIFTIFLGVYILPAVILGTLWIGIMLYIIIPLLIKGLAFLILMLFELIKLLFQAFQ